MKVPQGDPWAYLIWLEMKRPLIPLVEKGLAQRKKRNTAYPGGAAQSRTHASLCVNKSSFCIWLYFGGNFQLCD